MTHTYFVDCILETRATIRSSDGKKLWKILWQDGSISLEPLENMIDDTTYLEDIEPILQEYQHIATKYPKLRRQCLCCDKKTIPGQLFCYSTQCKFMKVRVQNILKN